MRPKTRKEFVEGISVDVEYGNVYPHRPEVERAVASNKADDPQESTRGYQSNNPYDDQNIPLNFKGGRIVAVSPGVVSELSLVGGWFEQPEKTQKTDTILIL